MKKFGLLFFTFLLNLIFLKAWGQGICGDSNYETGGFSLSTADACNTDIVTITNWGNLDSTKYLFNYQGETFSEVMTNGATLLDISGITRTGEYVVAQAGYKNGKRATYCQKLTVRAGDAPLYSYNYCFTSSLLDISIPDDPINSIFTSYEININGAITTILASALPYRNTFPFPKTGTNLLTVTGLGAPTCGTPPTEQLFYFGSTNNKYSGSPAITSLRVLNDKTVQLNISGMYNESYSLYKYEAGAAYSTATYLTAVQEGTFIDTTPSNKSYCYFIQSPISSCGTFSPRSSDVCSIVLEEVTPRSTTEINLQWTEIKSPNNYLFPIVGSVGTMTPKAVRIDKTNANSFNIINIPVSDTKYTDSPIDCRNEYCYVVQETNHGQINHSQFISKSYSNEVCVDFKLTGIAPPSQLHVSTEGAGNVITFDSSSTTAIDIQKWLLYKFNGTNFVKIDSLPSPLAVNEFTDTATPLNQMEQYKVQSEDKCGNISDLSDIVNSIYLKESVKNNLEWTIYNPFSPESISQYEVLYYDDNTGTTPPIAKVSLGSGTNTYPIDLSISPDKGSFRIKAIAGGGTVSYSNLISLVIKSSLYLPNAFTPNNDGNNDTFEIKGDLTNVMQFHMEIYASDGQKIFESKDINYLWNGQYPNSKPVPTGAYYYKLTADTLDDQHIEKAGIITIVY